MFVDNFDRPQGALSTLHTTQRSEDNAASIFAQRESQILGMQSSSCIRLHVTSATNG